MKARYITSIGVALATSVASQAISELDGRTLLSICTNGDALQKGYCFGYMVGYRDGKVAFPGQTSNALVDEVAKNEGGFSTSQTYDSCPFPRLPHHQMREIVVGYLNKHPEAWDKDAGFAVSNSLWNAFPCKSNM